LEGYREHRARGTADFPFSRYRFENRPAFTVTTRTQWHPDMEILYVHRGKLEVRLGQALHHLLPGQLLLIHPNVLHSIRVLTNSTCYDALVFSWELLSLPENHHIQKSLFLPIQTGKYMFPELHAADSTSYIQAICNASPHEANYPILVYSQLIAFFCALALKHALQPRNDGPKNQDDDMLRLCLSYLEENYSHHITLEQIAEQVHLHPNYLCARFKMLTGQTLFSQLIRLRIEKAARALRETRQSIQQIAAACGFENAGFFTRKFKDAFGITPSQYRKKFGAAVE